MNPTPSTPAYCYTISAGRPFLRTLARWVLNRYGKSPNALVSLLILLPNRRSCRTLREAFLAETEGAPLLLPKIQPMGDMDETSLFSYPEVEATLPPTISGLRRELLLMRLVRRGNASYTPPQAVELARQLGKLLDDALREGVSFDKLSSLVPAELSLHWQESLKFLSILSHHWPLILEAEGVIDPVDHRNRMLRNVAKAWRQKPPSHPVIAVGSTGLQPAVAQLLTVITRLPDSAVILPGLDLAMPEREWDLLSETHPHYALKQLLTQMDCPRSTVKLLVQDHPSARDACLRAVLQPPDATAHWSESTLPLREGLSGVTLVTADTQCDEARMIAIALRASLETGGKTAALVTSDRTLARMVTAQLQRFGIEIDDSAGHPLMDTPAATFLRLSADMVASQASPAALLALLRHPFAAAGRETAECRRLSRKLEISLLRGIRMRSGLGALMDEPEITEDVKSLLSDLAEHMADFSACFEPRFISFKTMLETHIAFAEWLATTPETPGKQRLWGGDAGNQLAAWLADILANAALLEDVESIAYPRLLEVLMMGQTYRSRFGLHPRLHILGPLEAQLTQFDRVIVGGLNEGSWPTQPPADPWMSRPMRSDFGLPAPERQIGQSAHDLYLLCSCPEVILTRANKVEGAPTVPSRWLVRLETLVKGLDSACYQAMRRDDWYNKAKASMDAPIVMPPYLRPQPCPPLAARPTRLHVTAIDTWLRDPYMVYAKHILRLRKLNPLDKTPDASDFGTLVHSALELFARAYPTALPEEPYAALLACGKEAFAAMLPRPSVACLWWPRFEGMAQWLVEREYERRGAIAQVVSELEGRWEFSVNEIPFTLTTRLDRVEIGTDGSVAIIDYKTGTLPTPAEIEKGLANQLLLEALVVKEGTVSPAVAHGGVISGLEYWKLSGQPEDCDIRNVRVEGMEEARARLTQIISDYQQPSMPYAAQNDPTKRPRFNDYEHLARLQEWEAV